MYVLLGAGGGRQENTACGKIDICSVVHQSRLNQRSLCTADAWSLKREVQTKVSVLLSAVSLCKSCNVDKGISMLNWGLLWPEFSQGPV